jgi:DNA-binding transcriptional LysR family regulator
MARFSAPGNGMQRTFEGSSLETIRHMVASGIGLTVLPRASVPDMDAKDGMLQFRPFDEPAPSRRVVIVWRKSFPQGRHRCRLRSGGRLQPARHYPVCAATKPAQALRICDNRYFPIL